MRFPKPARIKLQFEKNKLTLKYRDAETRRWDDIGEESKARHVVSSATYLEPLMTQTLSHDPCSSAAQCVDACAEP